MLHPYYPIRCGETRLIGIISGQSNQKQSKLRTSLPYMGRNIDCCGQNIPVCHVSRKTLIVLSGIRDTLVYFVHSATCSTPILQSDVANLGGLGSYRVKAIKVTDSKHYCRRGGRVEKILKWLLRSHALAFYQYIIF